MLWQKEHRNKKKKNGGGEVGRDDEKDTSLRDNHNDVNGEFLMFYLLINKYSMYLLGFKCWMDNVIVYVLFLCN